MSRRVLYALAESPRLASLARRDGAIQRSARRRAGRFLGGDDLEEAIATLARLHALGFDTGIDLFGEARTDLEAIDAVAEEYARLNERLAGLGAGVNVWVDLTNIGLDVSVDLCRDRLARIADTLPPGSRMQIRAHDSSRIDRILDLSVELAATGVRVMPTLQANLRRSPAYADRLIEAGMPILLVKGAHLEPPEAAYPWGEETDVAFVRLAHQLRAAGVETAIATHDPVIRESLLAALPDLGVEMLLGVRPADALELLKQNRRVRLYVPYGGEWLRYWLRRLGESRGA